MRVRIIAKLKNDNFYQARIQAGHVSIASLSRATGISQSCLGQFENFRRFPTCPATIEKLEKVLNVPYEYLFSEEVIAATGKIPKRFEFVRETPLLPENAILLLPENIKITAEEKEGQAVQLEKVIKETMAPRERLVLTKRFGLFGEAALTLEQTATLYHVTKERIRQIEAKAIRKLKHPSRMRIIMGEQPFLQEIEEDGLRREHNIKFYVGGEEL